MAVQVSQGFIDMLTGMRDGEQNRLGEIAAQLDSMTVENLDVQRGYLQAEADLRTAKKDEYDAVLADLEVG